MLIADGTLATVFAFFGAKQVAENGNKQCGSVLPLVRGSLFVPCVLCTAGYAMPVCDGNVPLCAMCAVYGWVCDGSNCVWPSMRWLKFLVWEEFDEEI